MICNSKTEFLTSLRIALENNNVTDRTDILTDFRQHFDDGAAAGETEAEVCRKLGDIDEIIKQYISEQPQQAQPGPQPQPQPQPQFQQQPTGGSMPDTSGFGAYSGEAPYSQPRYAPPPQPQSSSPSAGKIVGVLLLDVLIYSWCLPALAGLIIALISVALSFAIIGPITLIGGIVGMFVDVSGLIVTGFAPVSLLFFGIMMTGFAGMLVIASINSVKGYINIIIAIINQHARAFAGHSVFNKIGCRRENV